MSKINKLLWLDDYRDPFNLNDGRNPQFIKYCSEFKYLNDKIVWVKNYNEFVEWINENGLPSKISFDHDLADEHYAPQNRYDDYNDWAIEQKFKEKTGMDCAKWLIDYCIDNEKELPVCTVHSANPSGTKNIREIIANFIKFQNKINKNDILSKK